MKTTTHKIAYVLPEEDSTALATIDGWLNDKYRSQEQLLELKTVRSGTETELHIAYSFSTFEDANRFYRKVIMKMLKDLQHEFSARISGQTSRPSDCAD